MNTGEKLEQSSIVKEKGTQYFKVCRGGVDRAHSYKENSYDHKLGHVSNALISNASGGKIQAGVSAV